jgi:hypothetical protein
LWGRSQASDALASGAEGLADARHPLRDSGDVLHHGRGEELANVAGDHLEGAKDLVLYAGDGVHD